jgi:hypothetical protein
VYEAEERPHMQPPPDGEFDVPHWSEPKVHPDHHVQVIKSLYSVPTRYIGKTLRALGQDGEGDLRPARPQ